MKKSGFKRGMGKLMSRGVSKGSAFNKMKALAWKNQTFARSGQTKKSQYQAKRGLSRVASARKYGYKGSGEQSAKHYMRNLSEGN